MTPQERWNRKHRSTLRASENAYYQRNKVKIRKYHRDLQREKSLKKRNNLCIMLKNIAKIMVKIAK